jgi:hypothetical protein
MIKIRLKNSACHFYRRAVLKIDHNFISGDSDAFYLA